MKLLNWNEISDLVNARSGQERLLITITILLVLHTIVTYVVQPRLKSMQTTAANDISVYSTLIERRSDAIHKAADEYKKDSDLGTLQRIEELRKEINQFSNKLGDISDSFVDATEMVSLIKQLLNEHGLKLIRLENSLPEAVTTDSKTNIGIYKHGIQLEISGSYQNHIQFLDKLKRLPWHIFWKELNLEASEPGNAIVSLGIYTLNYSPVWLEI